MAFYLYRQSKNDDYFGFVLEACDKRVHKKCRTLHVGFKDRSDFEILYERVKESINFRQWELIKAMYTSDATTRSSLNSMRKQSF